MAQLSSDAFAFNGGLMAVEEAVRLLAERVPLVAETEAVPLVEADGRVLAGPLVAAIDLPGFDNSAVDGYAVRFADLTPDDESELPVEGRVAAGHAATGDLNPGHAVRIFTGAAMPAGFDTVFMQEDCRLSDGRVLLPSGLTLGANRRLRGEDIQAGTSALAAGRRLTPQDIGLAAALGVDTLTVRRPLKVAVFSTGDEVVAPGAPLAAGMVHDANRFILHGLLRRAGAVVTDLGILPDNRAALIEALGRAAAGQDLVLTSGGVSTGDEDHVKAAVEQVGSLVFWRLAIKPGRPVAMGVIQGVPFVGLPGNPVAVFIAFTYVVRPLLAALSGAESPPPRPLPVASGFAYRKKAGRREYVRVSVEPDPDGRLVAQKYPVEGAGVLTSLTRTHGLVELREEVTRVTPGDPVGFIDYAMLR